MDTVHPPGTDLWQLFGKGTKLRKVLVGLCDSRCCGLQRCCCALGPPRPELPSRLRCWPHLLRLSGLQQVSSMLLV